MMMFVLVRVLVFVDYFFEGSFMSRAAVTSLDVMMVDLNFI